MSRAAQVLKAFNEELSQEQKLKLIKKKGTILKLKKPVKGTGQIMVDGIEKSTNIHKETSYKVLGRTSDSPWADSLEELVNLFDWKDYEDRKAFSK